MNWYKLSQSLFPVFIDTSRYRQNMDKYLNTLVEEPISNEDFLHVKQDFFEHLNILIQHLSSNNFTNYIAPLNNLKQQLTQNTLDHEEAYELLWDIRKNVNEFFWEKQKQDNYSKETSNIAIKSREIVTNVVKSFSQMEQYRNNSYFTLQSKNELLSKLTEETTQNMNSIKNNIINLISKNPMLQKNRFPITVEASEDFNETGNHYNIQSGTNSAAIYVGDPEYNILFTVVLEESGKLVILGDELESFEEIIEEYGEEAALIKPVYNALRMLIKNPDIENTPVKTMSVYTARPIKDFKLYESAQNIPTDIFVSTKYDFVEGFAMDNRPRDIWKIRLKNKYLINDESNNPGYIFQTYSPDGEKIVPIDSINYVQRVE
jgi:hypothetical protein